MRTNEFASVIIAAMVLAGIGAALYRGEETVNILKAALGGFTDLIKVSAYGPPK